MTVRHLHGQNPSLQTMNHFHQPLLALSTLELTEKSKNRAPKSYIIRFKLGKIAEIKYTTKDLDSVNTSFYKIKGYLYF